jgi:hypothetical protein
MPHLRRTSSPQHALRLDASSIRYGSIAGVIALFVSWVVQKL